MDEYRALHGGASGNGIRDNGSIQGCIRGRDLRSLFDSFLENFLTEEDFIYLSTLGINTLMIPVNYHYFIDDQHPEVFLEKGFKVLDPVLDLCRKHKIYAIIELHAVPEGQKTRLAQRQ